jgi:uncharacterized membrane protein (DUF373 family)
VQTRDSTIPPSAAPRRHGLSRFTDPLIANLDRALYLMVALLLMLAAMLFVIYSLFHFLGDAPDDLGLAVIELINDLLLVLIMLEVLGTVRSYLATGSTSLRVFLYMGIISAIRHILSIGAQTTLGERIDREEFRHLMIDLSVNSGVVLVLALALYLVGLAQAQTNGGQPAPAQPAGPQPEPDAPEDEASPVRPYVHRPHARTAAASRVTCVSDARTGRGA